MKENCWLPLRASQIAQENGFLKREEKLACPFAQGCLGIAVIGEENCQWLNYLEKNPLFRKIFLAQGNKPLPLSPRKRFFKRLEKTAQMRAL